MASKASKKKVDEAGEGVKAVTPAPKKTKKAVPKAKAAPPVKEPKVEKRKAEPKTEVEPVEEAKPVEEVKEETAGEVKPVAEEVKPAEEVEAVEPVEETKPAEEVKEEAEEEKAPEKPFTTAKPRPLPRPLEKSTLELDPETRRLLAARKRNKASLPAFPRIDSHKKKKLKPSWRKPRGHHAQLRRQRKAKGSIVKIGFGSPAAVRGLHPSGYEEVLVHRPEDVRGITRTQAIRIGRTVGRKKQAEIEKVAKELNIKVLNPLNVFEEV